MSVLTLLDEHVHFFSLVATLALLAMHVLLPEEYGPTVSALASMGALALLPTISCASIAAPKKAVVAKLSPCQPSQLQQQTAWGGPTPVLLGLLTLLPIMSLLKDAGVVTKVWQVVVIALLLGRVCRAWLPSSQSEEDPPAKAATARHDKTCEVDRCDCGADVRCPSGACPYGKTFWDSAGDG
mmetsp:Transcript_68179/g.142478  ORF Transcript_68179/g.142478 Transcript_68179/m.142478 type:complete len:183 (-) Transcript_68179:60-608(-)